MYRNLSPRKLGITGRQSELIELTLTYGFRGMEVEIEEFAKRVEHRGLDYAARFILSAKIKIGGFDLPVRYRADDATYKADLADLDRKMEAAVAIGADRCYTIIQPGSDQLPYHENFELHRQRLSEIAERLAKHSIRLGLGFLAPSAGRPSAEFQFIQDAEALVTLIKSVAADNVGLLLDSWHWHFGGGSNELLDSLGPANVTALNVADVSDNADPSKIQDEDRVLPRENGIIDNISLLTRLKEADFAGPVTPAPHARAFTNQTRDSIVQQCGQAMEQLWATAGLSRAAKAAAASDDD